MDGGEDRFIAVPAVELSNFAVNEAYRQNNPNSKKLGRNTFVEFIVPLVKKVQCDVAVQALYIYALPNKKLIEYYGSLGFMRLNADEEKFVHQHVKPKYDEGCIFMCQGI